MNTSMTNGSFGSSATTSSLLVQRIKYFGGYQPWGLFFYFVLVIIVFTEPLPFRFLVYLFVVTSTSAFLASLSSLYKEVVTTPKKYLQEVTGENRLCYGWRETKYVLDKAKQHRLIVPIFARKAEIIHKTLGEWVREKEVSDALRGRLNLSSTDWMSCYIDDVVEIVREYPECINEAIIRLISLLLKDFEDTLNRWEADRLQMHTKVGGFWYRQFGDFVRQSDQRKSTHQIRRAKRLVEVLLKNRDTRLRS